MYGDQVSCQQMLQMTGHTTLPVQFCQLLHMLSLPACLVSKDAVTAMHVQKLLMTASTLFSPCAQVLAVNPCP